MHRTHPVINMLGRILLCFSLVSGFGNAGSHCQSRRQILDLTATSASERRSMGVPGSGWSSLSDQRVGKKLSLDISVQSAKLESGNSAIVHLSLLNSGSVSFAVPSCTDQVKAHGNGAKGRRTFQFIVEFLDQRMERLDSEIADVTFGSSNRNCTTPLPPGDSLTVVYRASLPPRVSELANRTGEVNLRASVTEVELKDASFAVSNTSEPVISGIVRLEPH